MRASQSRPQSDERRRARSGVRPARRSGFGRGAQPAADRGARGAARPSRDASPSRSSVWRSVAPGRRAAAASRAGDSSARRSHRRGPQLEFFNGLGGFAADGREYVTILGEGQWTPAPWINVIANPVVRLPGLGRGRGLHLVGQQPAESAHAVVERSGQRPAGRSDLCSRRRHRRALGTDRAADSRGRRALRRAARPGLQPSSSTPRTASRSNLLQYVPLDGLDQDFAA